MTRIDLQNYRNQLRVLDKRLRGEVNTLREEVISGSPEMASRPIEQSEVASHEAEDRRTRTVLSHEELILDEVEHALNRIKDGTFGRCSSCGRLINRQRLDAVPYSRYCVGCAEREGTVEV